MARIILKEKYSLADLFGLLMTIVGILFIAQPPFMFPRKAKKINENFVDLFLNSSHADSYSLNHFYNCSSIKFHLTDYMSSIANVEKKLFQFEHGLIRSLNETQNLTSLVEFETKVFLNESMVILRNTSALCGPESESVLKKALGISTAIMGAVALTGVTILLKKLNNRSVHYSVNLAYASYFGFPISLLISIILIATGVEKKNKIFFENPSLIGEQTAYSVASAVCAIYSQFLMVISMRHEEASKACLFRATDLFFTFALQYIILSIKPNLYNTIGSNLIFLGVLVIMVHKILDQRFNKNKKEGDSEESENMLKTILFFKF
jgi:drug/metabolite transporter (DMT)-like permease